MFYKYKTNRGDQIISRDFEHKISTISKNSTLKEWIEVYLEYFVKVNNTKKTYISYYHSYKCVLDKIGKMKLKNIKSSTIQELYHYLFTVQQLNTNTIVKLHSLLSRLFDILVMYKVINYNIMNDVVKPKRKKSNRTQTLTYDQLEKLFIYIKDYIIFIPTALTLVFALRKSEAIDLKWSNVDFKAKKIKIETTKVDTVKTLPISDSTLLFLLSWKKEQADLRNKYGKNAIYNDYICTLENGQKMDSQYFYNCFKRICKDLEFDDDISIRSIRKTFGTIMLENDVSLFLTSKWLGHSNTRTTEEYYVDVANPQLKKVANKIDIIFENLFSKSKKEDL